MSEESKPDVIDVTEANFEYAVVSASQHRPVVVDFWAEWCGPCKQLGPVLEKLAAEYNGAFLLARIDVEQAPVLAQQFQAQSIPMVLLVKDGKVTDHFLGALPEKNVREFLDKHIVTQADLATDDAGEFERAGDLDAAEAGYQAALESDPDHAESIVGLARIDLVRKKFDEAGEALKKIEEDSDLATEARRHTEAMDFWREADGCGAPAECRAAAEAASADLAAQLTYAACLATDRQVPEAIEVLLSILGRDKSYRGGLARKAILSLFFYLGETSERTRDFQDRMARVLY